MCELRDLGDMSKNVNQDCHASVTCTDKSPSGIEGSIYSLVRNCNVGR